MELVRLLTSATLNLLNVVYKGDLTFTVWAYSCSLLGAGLTLNQEI